MPDAPTTAQQFREAQAAEYGVYVAAHAIDIDGARAFNAGDPVPASHVERGVVASDDVVKTSTKAGQALAAGTTEKG
jgi:hypothetical protein